MTVTSWQRCPWPVDSVPQNKFAPARRSWITIPYRMAGRATTGGSAAHRDRCSQSSWLLRSFPAFGAGLLLLALSPPLQAQKSSPHQTAPVASPGTGPAFGSSTLPAARPGSGPVRGFIRLTDNNPRSPGFRSLDGFRRMQLLDGIRSTQPDGEHRKAGSAGKSYQRISERVWRVQGQAPRSGRAALAQGDRHLSKLPSGMGGARAGVRRATQTGRCETSLLGGDQDRFHIRGTVSLLSGVLSHGG